MAEKDKIEKIVNIRNKRASFEYEFIETYVAGIALRGTEIKSIRQQKMNLQDAHCYLHDKGLWVKNMHISLYGDGSYLNHDPMRERKLLLKKKELRRIEKKLDDQGITVIPLRLFINDRGFAKVEIAVAKGKKLFDKRADMKEKDVKRELSRADY